MSETVLDLTRSKRPQVIEDERTIAHKQLDIDKYGRLIQDAELVEQIMSSEEHQALVAISRARVFDIVRQMLKISLTPEAESVAFHNDVQGRLRERLMILDDLEGVIAYKGKIQRLREALQNSVKDWSKRREKKRKE